MLPTAASFAGIVGAPFHPRCKRIPKCFKNTSSQRLVADRGRCEPTTKLSIFDIGNSRTCHRYMRDSRLIMIAEEGYDKLASVLKLSTATQFIGIRREGLPYSVQALLVGAISLTCPDKPIQDTCRSCGKAQPRLTQLNGLHIFQGCDPSAYNIGCPSCYVLQLCTFGCIECSARILLGWQPVGTSFSSIRTWNCNPAHNIRIAYPFLDPNSQIFRPVIAHNGIDTRVK